MSILVSVFTTTNSFFFRKLEFSINDEHDYGHYDTQSTDHKVCNAQKLILASHPGHVAENYLLCSIKAQNRIIWEHVKDMQQKCSTFTVKCPIILWTINTHGVRNTAINVVRSFQYQNQIPKQTGIFSIFKNRFYQISTKKQFLFLKGSRLRAIWDPIIYLPALFS